MRGTSMELTGQTALITGAASGIGAALARLLAARGCHLALADINAEGLQQVADDLARPGLRVTTHVVDMAQPDVAQPLVDAVVAAHGGLSLLFNNAGVALGGTFEQLTPRDFDWLMQINLHGPISLTRAALPALHQAPEAGVVNISSLFGLIAPGGQSAYCTAKFGLRGFSEALRHELVGTKITVLPVHPGGIATNIAKNAKTSDQVAAKDQARQQRHVEKMLIMPPDQAARIIVDALVRRKRRVLVGKDAKRADLIQRLMPGRYWDVIAKSM